MKVLIFGFFLALACADYVPHWSNEVAAATRSKPVRIQTQGKEDGNSCDSIYSCQDCHTSRICRPTVDGLLSLLKTITCPSERPYCEPLSGSCVSEEPESCGEKDDNFICMGNGKFPDKDCTKFHVCLNQQSVTFQCSDGKKYNPLTKTCEHSSICGTFDCTALQGYKVPHSEHAGYYAYCSQDSQPLVVDSCLGNYELNVTSQICEPPCNTEGIVSDILDCHFYFKCSKSYIKRDFPITRRERLRCPEGQAYSTKDYLCVDEANVASCKST